jgi:hypothetical protein
MREMIQQCCRCASETKAHSWEKRLDGYVCVLCFDYIKIEDELSFFGKLLPEKIHPIAVESE